MSELLMDDECKGWSTGDMDRREKMIPPRSITGHLHWFALEYIILLVLHIPSTSAASFLSFHSLSSYKRSPDLISRP